jgi:hypothetical protein
MNRDPDRRRRWRTKHVSLLVEHQRVQWRSRAHFYAVTSRAMRRILLNYAGSRRASKRCGDRMRMPPDENWPGVCGASRSTSGWCPGLVGEIAIT